MTFFMNHRRVWVSMTEEKGSVKVLIGASANKNKAPLERKIEKVVRAVSAGHKGGSNMNSSVFFGLATVAYIFAMILYISYLAFRKNSVVSRQRPSRLQALSLRRLRSCSDGQSSRRSAGWDGSGPCPLPICMSRSSSLSGALSLPISSSSSDTGTAASVHSSRR